MPNIYTLAHMEGTYVEVFCYWARSTHAALMLVGSSKRIWWCVHLANMYIEAPDSRVHLLHLLLAKLQPPADGQVSMLAVGLLSCTCGNSVQLRHVLL